MHTTPTAHGMQVACRAFNGGDLAPLARFIEDANASDPAIKACGRQALFGAAVALAKILIHLRDDGRVNFTGDPLVLPDELHYAITTNNLRLFSVQVQSLINTAQNVANELPGTVARMVDLPVQAPAEPRPQRVEIVGMPSRRTESVIERDGKGNIKSAAQVETDLAATE